MDHTFNYSKPQAGARGQPGSGPNEGGDGSDQHDPPQRQHRDMAAEQGRRGKGYGAVEQVKRLKKNGVKLMMMKEHSFVLTAQLTFDDFLKPENAKKNRYQNLVLYDETRVMLDDEYTKERGDYIHASYVDGYDRKCQYILSQAPFTLETENEFWRMVWHEKPSCIVLITPLISCQNVMLARNFWPNAKQDKTYLDNQIRVITENVRFGSDCDYYELCVSRATVRQSFGLPLLHYRHWEKDEQVPGTLLGFASKARLIAQQQEQELLKVAGTAPGAEPPMLVVCSTGVHRSGTFTALDILLRRLQERRRIALKETIKQMRRERYGCVHLARHYTYLTEAIVNYAIQAGHVHTDNLPTATNFVAGMFTLG